MAHHLSRQYALKGSQFYFYVYYHPINNVAESIRQIWVKEVASEGAIIVVPLLVGWYHCFLGAIIVVPLLVGSYYSGTTACWELL